jgi:hypothetical protein
MITRSVSNNMLKQVTAVVDELVTKVTTRKRVTWAPEGITKAMTFEIEPWRRIRPTPPTNIRCRDYEVLASPFKLPDAPMMKPLANYSDYTTPGSWWPIIPSAPVSCDLVLIDDDDDDDKKPSAAPALARSQPVSLAVIYAIAEELRKRKDLDKFIDEPEMEELETDMDDEFGPWTDDKENDWDDEFGEWTESNTVVQTDPPNFDDLEERFNALLRQGTQCA